MATDIKYIDKQVSELISNIQKLQTEIKTYQSGYVAFEKSSAALELATQSQREISNILADSLKSLKEVDTVKLVNQIDKTANKLADVATSIEKLAQEMHFKEEIDNLKQQNEQIIRQISLLNSRLDEGVTLKKRKWLKGGKN